jgi:shikimate kinase
MTKVTLPNIFLVGPMAAGKSTIGRLLARELERKFYDSDHELEHATGVRIAWIYDLEGEEGFRKREENVIEEVTKRPSIVLATGGGSVLSELSRQILRNRGYVIHLQVSLEEQVQRTLRDKHRPLIQTKDRRGALEKLYAEREPLYHEVADWSILTDSGPSTRIVHEIYQHLCEHFVVV